MKNKIIALLIATMTLSLVGCGNKDVPTSNPVDTEKETVIESESQMNDNTETQEVLESEKKVLLDFWASWCGPCRMVLPIVEQIAAERPDIKVCKINVDEQPGLAAQFGVMSIPTLAVMEKGKLLRQSAGARPKEEILAML